MATLFSRIKAWRRRTKIIAVLVVLMLGYGGYAYWHASQPNYQFIAVGQGSLTERVDLTGSVIPVGTVSLAFQNAGTVAHVNKQVGDTVAVGGALASLDTASLATQLAAAQADVAAAQATLASLKSGATTSDIAVARAALNTAKQSLAGDYTSAVSAVIDSYAKASDAIRTNLNDFFTNPETTSPLLIFTSSASIAARNAQYERGQLNSMFTAWQSELASLSASSSPATVHTALDTASTNLTQIARFLADLSNATINATSFPSSSSLTASTAKTAVATSISSINTALANVNAAAQSINTQEAAVAQSQASLNQTLAGATQDQINAQQATVDAAIAKANTIRVQIAQATLVSPIAGTVSVQNAKVGQTVTPNDPVVTVFSSNALEVDVNLPEVDLGKVATGDDVDITFDAFPGETFTGTVYSIEPAETVVSGVVGYKTKIHFTKLDPRIKSGLTANLSIITDKKADALYLPQYALLQTDTGTFVETLANGVVTKQPVTTGIRDDNGNVEILSGVTAGEKVLNIGLKSGS